MLANPRDSDYHLKLGSPGIDAGYNRAVLGWLTTDFEGDTHAFSSDGDGLIVVNMRVDEYWRRD